MLTSAAGMINKMVNLNENIEWLTMDDKNKKIVRASLQAIKDCEMTKKDVLNTLKKQRKYDDAYLFIERYY